MKYYVVTRVFYEKPYINFFIQHYLNLKFDKIILLIADKHDYSNIIDKSLSKYIIKYNVNNDENDILHNNLHLIKKHEYDWLLHVDVDEFLILENSFNNNIRNYISKKIQYNCNINYFYFRWGEINMYDIEYNTKDLNNIINKYKIYKKDAIKSMIKKNYIDDIVNPHYFINNNNNYNIYFEDRILKNINVIIPVNVNSYKEHILVHINIRNMNNLLFKSICNPYNNMFIFKKINFNLLNTILNDNKYLNITDDKYFELIQNLSSKFKESNNNRIENNCIDIEFINKNFKCLKNNFLIYNKIAEHIHLKYMCTNYKISYDKISNFIINSSKINKYYVY